MWATAIAVLVAHVAASGFGPYEFHRDEFLYLAMGRHLQWWRMDFPPFIAAVARLTQWLGGGLAPWSVRLSSALACSALIVLAGWTARRLGGGAWAQGVAALAVATSPLFLRAGTLFQPVVFDQLWWTLGYIALLRLSTDNRDRSWAFAAVVVGLGLLTKFSIGFFAVGVVVGVLALPAWRRRLASPRPWLAVAAALLIGSASLVGQIRLGWPLRQQMAQLQAVQLDRVGVADFLTGQVLLGPAFLLAIVGMIALLTTTRLRDARIVGIATLASFLLLLALHGKSYYIGPIYPVLWAAGAVLVEGVGNGRWTRPLRWGTVAALLAYGLVALPFGLPILPPARMAHYAAGSGVSATVTTNVGEMLPLPQDYADMLGWKAIVDTVASVYHALPAEERAQAVIVADNYGEAGALDLYGPALGLPPAISAAGTYWHFGPGTLPGEVVIVIGDKPEGLRKFADSVEIAAQISNPWGVPEEQSLQVLVGRQPKTTIQALWPKFAGRY
ncbi:MAG: glycosyltransferase family 39 protein [Gemmatimonadales bacterium]